MQAGTIETTTAAETEAAGEALAAQLAAGDVVLIAGELGAGKTTFVRGACRALGVEGAVTSPTYTVGQVYGARGLEVAHVDLFRLPALDGEDPALLDDYLTPDRIAFVEWPGAAAGRIDRVAALVRIEHRGGDRRAIAVEASA